MRADPIAAIDPRNLKQKLLRKIISVPALALCAADEVPLELRPYRVAPSCAAAAQRRSMQAPNCQTGAGRPVFDIFKQASLAPLGITITGGDSFSQPGHDQFRLVKILLVSVMQSLLHAGELKIARSPPDAPTLVAELKDFRANIYDAAHASFSARLAHGSCCARRACAGCSSIFLMGQWAP
jgi:hypothetical protein